MNKTIVRSWSGEGDRLAESDRQKVAAFVESQAGIMCPAAKHNLVESRLRKRQRILNFASLHDYIQYALDSDDGVSERIHLLDAITTNKTDFYREQDHFSYLKSQLASKLKREFADHEDTIRFWSAGCSSGEEPYTLAIELLELQREYRRLHFHVTATDISLSCLKAAKRAVYNHERIETMNLALRRRYLLRSRDKQKNLVQIAPEVRKHVSFSSFNLLHDDYAQLGQFDVIFCRNVMIYFNNDDRRVIAAQFSRCLKSGGLLFLGHSESLIGNQNAFVRERPTVYRRIYDAGKK